MADIVDPVTRSRMMSNIKGRDTKPEVIIRKELFRFGFRYRLHDKNIIGTPDLVLKKHRAVIFVNGCFWHGHGCSIAKMPSSNNQFWFDKIMKNKERDKRNADLLLDQNWRVLSVWECSIRGKEKLGIERTIDIISNWLVDHSNSKLTLSSIEGGRR